MTTLLHTTEGSSPMHELVEDQQDKETRASEVDDKFIRWEALRQQKEGGAL